MAAVRTAGYKTPTPIQQQAIPLVLQGHDVMGLAQTGTGKTAAFVLPILQRLIQTSSRHVRVLILAPTRELAEQTHRTVKDLGGNSRVRSVAIYGGISKKRQSDALRNGVDVVVACPGRLLDHIEDGAIDLSHIEVLVLDEADRMCDMGFLPDIRRILLYLRPLRQTLFFSATMPPEIQSLANRILKKPVLVQIGNLRPTTSVAHCLYPTSHADKPKLLLALLQQIPRSRVLIFTRTKVRACSLALSLKKNGFRVSALQGDMEQRRRDAAINGFRSGEYDILVATDIAARGLDISQISHVINFDVPDTADAYTHRIGRTGRASETGEAFTLTVGADEAVVHEIEKALGARIERRWLGGLGGVDHVQPGPLPVRSRFRSFTGRRRRRR
jgi:ATP-dependent RNA helicase RhlE